ncbi:MAG: RNA repair transcriptional activator RtcR [Opitutaceae bacterium]
MKRTVIISLLGSQLDGARPQLRWEKWRPNIALCQQEDLLVDRFELIHEPNFETLGGSVQEDMQSVSPETTVNRHLVEFGDPWDFQAVYGALYDFVQDYDFNLDDEDYYIHITTGTHVCQICLFLLTESRLLPGKLIQTSPPKRPNQGIEGSYSIIDLDLACYDQIAARFAQEQMESLAFLKSGIETLNQTFNTMIEEIERVAINSKSPILLMGPTGAGKSQLARKVYELKKARSQVSGSFVEVNCGTLRGDAAMSALFGHIKGSFTGAMNDRPGLLLTANKGIIFLDEIGELGLDEQAMLLRALEEKRFLPLGADAEKTSDFQVISGTNRDLLKEVKAGRFRSDLLARINLWTFELPGLKDRREDILPNIDYELDRFAKDNGRTVRFNKESLNSYQKFAKSHEAEWSGNFRDLNASITRMATLAGGKRISTEVTAKEIEKLKQLWRESTNDPAATTESLEEILSPERIEMIDVFDRPQLAAAIATCKASKNLSDAGRKLFNISRTKRKTANDADRLRKYLSKFDLSWDEITSSEILTRGISL